MRLTKVAKTYAKSFLDLAVEKGSLETVKKDMELVLATYQDSKELQLLVESPIINSDKKFTVLKGVFEGKVDAFTLKFIEVIANKGREAALGDVAYSFAHLYLEHKNILKTVIKSVDGVGDQVKKKVEELVKSAYQKEVLIEEVKDETLIGGFVITVGDKQVDASISRQLATLRNTFSENPYISEI